MKNIPKVIYLQAADAYLGEELIPCEVTWCQDQINSDDIQYVNSQSLIDSFSRRIEEINAELKTIKTTTMSGGQKANRLRGIKKELQNYILSIQTL